MGGFLEKILMYFFSSLYLCVCVVYLQPAVPIWWTDLGSIMSPAGVPFRAVALAPLTLWVIRNHLQQAYPKHTAAAKGVARSKHSLHGFYWFPHLSASLLLLITNQDTASYTRPWATGAQLEPWDYWRSACIVHEELCYLFREASVWLRCLISECVAENGLSCLWRTWIHGLVSSSSALDTKNLQITLAIWFLAENDRFRIG